MSFKTGKWNGRARQSPGAAGWLGLAASPTFALMAWMSWNDASQLHICSPASDILPIDGMTWMYLLMSLFHATPWLKLAFAHPRQFKYPTTQTEPQTQGDQP
ncbi:hypothetical protein [Roseibium salinum]|uniref:Uncharacterized protein n=1 Tax=Roseibium salinum TaxID=1604349 RepID=A0ABT3QY43_9HYPH|nr:hypothetical protein [Roseibium sp. DSM 29163]MCX2721751.1 hypothetical protein [Roseibium sp. DSM 29163]